MTGLNEWENTVKTHRRIFGILRSEPVERNSNLTMWTPYLLPVIFDKSNENLSAILADMLSLLEFFSEQFKKIELKSRQSFSFDFAFSSNVISEHASFGFSTILDPLTRVLICS